MENGKASGESDYFSEPITFEWVKKEFVQIMTSCLF
jgi:hypothetical protein